MQKLVDEGEANQNVKNFNKKLQKFEKEEDLKNKRGLTSKTKINIDDFIMKNLSRFKSIKNKYENTKK